MLDLSPAVEVVSFDVFDTVVARNVYHPQDLYLRIQDRLADSGTLANQCTLLRNFRLNRTAAEQKAREQLTDREEVTLDEIVSELTEQCGLTPDFIETLVVCEIEEELRSVVPVEPVVSLVRQLRQGGKKIVFVSDMYLPYMVIRGMLQRVGALEAEDRVYVSGSIGKKKSTGSLFRHIMDDLDLRPDQMVHVGDYLLSDFLIPSLKNGIRSIPVRIARNNVYERLWGDACHCLYCCSVAGASRAARTAHFNDGATSIETVLYNMGCNVLGPILAGFILWVLQQAEQAGIRRLYFLSRDGEIMLEVARELASRLGIEIELRYLFVSRTAVFPALMGTGIDARTITWLTEETIVLTPRILADRLKVDAGGMYEQLLRAGADLLGLDVPLDSQTLDLVCALLVNESVLKGMLAESGQTALQNLSGYLEQEMFFDGSPFAVIDLGWHGGIQDVIYACFKKQLGDNGIAGYYFGVDLPGEPANRKSGYFFNHCGPTDTNQYRHLFRVLLELLCSGSHGMVRNYCNRLDGTYVPLFDTIEHPTNLERIAFVRQGVATFIEHLDCRGVKEIDYQHTGSHILGVMKKLFFFPSRHETLALGGLHFSADQAGHGLHQVASPFTLASAIRYLTKRTYAGRSLISSWFFASWKCSGAGIWILLSPIVVFLRLYYCGSDVLRFSKLIFLDFINNFIGTTMALTPRKDSVKTKLS